MSLIKLVRRGPLEAISASIDETAALVNAINLGMHQIFERVKDALADQTKSVKMLRDDVLTEQQAGQVPTRRTLVVRCQVFALPLAELSGIATRGCGGRDGV